MAGCPTIPEESYSLFSERTMGDIFEKRVPVMGAIEFSLRCNLRCVHCYCGTDPAEGELDTDGFKVIIDQITEAGCLWLLITGGEPLLREDFPELYLYVKKKGIFPVIFTNATRITPDIAALLSEWPPYNLEVSLYGATARTYESVTRVAGSFERCLRGIELLLEHGLKPGLKSVIIKENAGELDELHALAAQYGLPYRFDTFINATLGNGLEPTRLRLDPETVVALDQKYLKRRQAWGDFIEEYGDNPPSPTLFSCGAGINAFHIDPRGRLYPCTLFRDQYFDLMQGDFAEGWNGLIKDIRFRQPSKDGCNTCRLRSLCGCCPGRAALETGDPESAIEHLCRVATLRSQIFGNEDMKLAGLGLRRHMESRLEKRA